MNPKFQVFLLLSTLLFCFNKQTSAQYIEEICSGVFEETRNSGYTADTELQLLKCIEESNSEAHKVLLKSNLARCYSYLKVKTKSDSLFEVVLNSDSLLNFKGHLVALEQLAIVNLYRNVDLHFEYLNKMLALAKKHDFTPGIIRSKSILANSHYVLKDQQAIAYQYFIEALKLPDFPHSDYLSALSGAADCASKLAYPTSDSLFDVGFSYIQSYQSPPKTTADSLSVSSFYAKYGESIQKEGNLRNSLEFLLKAVNLKPKSKKYQYALTSHYYNISKLFLSLLNFDKAHEYVDLDIEISQKNNFKRPFIHALILKASIYQKSEDYKSAKKYYRRFLDETQDYKKTENNLLATAYGDLTFIFVHQDSMDQAKYFLDKAIALESNMKNAVGLLNINSAATIYYYKTGQFRKAKIYVEKLEAYSKQFNNSYYQMVALKYKADILYQLKDFKSAFNNFTYSTQIKDSLYRDEQNFIVSDMEAKYLKAEQDKEIASLEVENVLNESKVETQKRTIYLGSIGLISISILSFFLFNLNRKIKLQNETIRNALSDKELLLKEIHHRVKNNLQVISSLLSIQSRYIKDPTALDAITEGRNRVKSMAIIHQDLYRQENLTSVNVEDYFEKLIESLFASYKTSEEQINLTTDIDKIMLDIDTIVPVGLIVNELISNALKYAFPGDREGNIHVILKEIDGKLILSVKDDGIGIKDSDHVVNGESFGFELIDAFVHKLDAKLIVENHRGTSITMEINNYKKAG